jgi:ectoine hydroxylase-related dioxygenase (phytanoyl-CoA dioxygenase family)
MILTPKQLELLPSDADVKFYQEHGYYISKKIYSEEEIDDAVYGSERYYEGERDFFLPGSLKPFEGWKPDDGNRLRINDYVSLVNREISNLVRHPLLGAIAAKLSGSPAIRLWHDQMIYKPAKADQKTEIGWHSDRAYWKTCNSINMLTAWIPFHDCDESMGTLMIVDGSHRWLQSDDLKGFHSRKLGELEEGTFPGESVIKVPMNLKKGQVSFHHCLTIHGSGSNRSNFPRLSLSVHLQDGDNRYREEKRHNDKVVWHRNDILCRTEKGYPNYADPDFCPQLWPPQSI